MNGLVKSDRDMIRTWRVVECGFDSWLESGKSDAGVSRSRLSFGLQGCARLGWLGK